MRSEQDINIRCVSPAEFLIHACATKGILAKLKCPLEAQPYYIFIPQGEPVSFFYINESPEIDAEIARRKEY